MSPEEVPEPGAEDGEVAGVVHRLDTGGVRLRLGPDDGGAVAGQRQDRQRARRHEELVRHAVVRPLVRDGADERGLAVAPALAADAGAGGGGARAAVGAHDHPGAERAAIGELAETDPSPAWWPVTVPSIWVTSGAAARASRSARRRNRSSIM
jgi:hypothetical protein